MWITGTTEYRTVYGLYGGYKRGKRMDFLYTGVKRMERKEAVVRLGKNGKRSRAEVFANTMARGGFMSGVFVWCELVFHICVFGKVDGNLIFPVLFAVAAGFLLSIPGTIFRGHINKIITIVITVLAALWYSTQTVYEHIFKAFLSVNSIKENGADAVGEFYMQALKGIVSELFPIFLYFLPLVLLLFLLRNKKIGFWRSVWEAPFVDRKSVV